MEFGSNWQTTDMCTFDDIIDEAFVRSDEYSIQELLDANCDVCDLDSNTCMCYKYSEQDLKLLKDISSCTLRGNAIITDKVSDFYVRNGLTQLMRSNISNISGLSFPSPFRAMKFVPRYTAQSCITIPGCVVAADYYHYLLTHPRLAILWLRPPPLLPKEEIKVQGYRAYTKQQRQSAVVGPTLLPDKMIKKPNVFKEQRKMQFYQKHVRRNYSSEDLEAYKTILATTHQLTAPKHIRINTMLRCLQFKVIPSHEYVVNQTSPLIEYDRTCLVSNYVNIFGLSNSRLATMYHLFNALLTAPQDLDISCLASRMNLVSSASGRDLLHNMAKLSRTRGLLDIRAVAERHNITYPWLNQKFVTGEPLQRVWRSYVNKSFDGYSLSLRLAQCKRYSNFIQYVRLFYAFVIDTFRNINYNVPRFMITPQGHTFLATYIDYCTTTDVAETMFSNVKKTFENMANIDVSSLNANFTNALKTQAQLNVTAKTIEETVKLVDVPAINRLTTVVDSFVQSYNFIPSFDITPLFDKIKEFLNIDDSIVTELKKLVTPQNLILLTGKYILYRQLSDKLLKACVILSILNQFGLIRKGIDIVSTLAKQLAVGMGLFPSEETPVETVWGVESIWTILSALSGSFSGMCYGVITTIIHLAGLVVPNIKTIKQLIRTASDWGRMFTFMNSGAKAADAMIRYVLGSIISGYHYVMGHKKPETPSEKWAKDFKSWALRVAVYSSPIVNDYVRVNKRVRDKALCIHEEGIELQRRMPEELPTQARAAFNRTLYDSRKITELANNYNRYASVRPPAYHVVFESPPGLGKTNFIHILKTAFGKAYFPEVDPANLIYMVPVNNAHFDGYSQQPIMVLDDYNVVNDPIVASKIFYMVSNIPMILPMAMIEDKGQVNEASVIFSTTNNAYLVPEAINCKKAFLRRRRHVIRVKVEDKSIMVDSRINTEKALEYYRQKYRNDGACAAIYEQSREHPDATPEELINYAAQKSVDNYDYYQFQFLSPLESKISPIGTMGMKDFMEFLLDDYKLHMEHEEALLQRNENAANSIVTRENAEIIELKTSMASRILELSEPVHTNEINMLHSAMNALEGVVRSCWLARLSHETDMNVDEVIAAAVEHHGLVNTVPDIPHIVDPDIEREMEPPEETLSEGERRSYILEQRSAEQITVMPANITDEALENMDLSDDDPQFGYIACEFRDSTGSVLPYRLATGLFMRLKRLPETHTWVVAYDIEHANLYEYDITQAWFWEGMLLLKKVHTEDFNNYCMQTMSDVRARVDVTMVVEQAITANESRFDRIFSTIVRASSVMLDLTLVLCTAVIAVGYLGMLIYFCKLCLSGDQVENTTKYNQQPQVARRTRLNWSETCTQKLVGDVLGKLKRNMQLVRIKQGRDFISCQMFYLGGSVALVPAHFLELLNPEAENLIEISTEMGDWQKVYLIHADCIRVTGRDVAAITLRHGHRMFPSTRKYWMTKTDFDDLVGESIIINKRVDKETTSRASTTVLGYSQMKLPNAGDVEAIMYNGAAEHGVSGGVVALADPDKITRSSRCLAGIQSASAKHWGAVAPFNLEDYDFVMKYFGEPQVHDLPECYETKFDLKEEKFMGATGSDIFKETVVVAVAPKEKTPYLGLSTQLQHTPIAGDFPEVVREPAILTPFDRRRQKFVDCPHFLFKSANKYCRDVMEPIPPSEMEVIVDSFTSLYRNSRAMEDLKVLTIYEAIKGTNHTNKLNVATSPGIPYIYPEYHRVLPGKRDLVRYDAEGEIEYVCPQFISRCEQLLNDLDNNIIPAIIQCDSMKDELRDTTAGKQNETRLITVMPAELSVVARQLNLDFHGRLHKLSRNAWPVSVGVNLDSADIGLIMQKLGSVGGGMLCFDLDVRNYDGHFSPDLFEMNCRMLNRLYNGARSTARRNMYNIIQFGYVQLGKFIYKKYRGMSSGFVGTAEENSDAHLKLVYYVWRVLAPVKYRSLLCFLQHVVTFVYGDDVIFSVSIEASEWFTPSQTAKIYSQMGWPATPANKNATFSGFVSSWDLTFLKHKFSPCGQIVLSRLDPESILSLCVWQRGGGSEQFYMNLRDAMYFAVSHGPVYFYGLLGRINSALRRNFLPEIFYSYKDVFEDKYANYWTA